MTDETIVALVIGVTTIVSGPLYWMYSSQSQKNRELKEDFKDYKLEAAKESDRRGDIHKKIDSFKDKMFIHLQDMEREFKSEIKSMKDDFYKFQIEVVKKINKEG